ncbi:MAG: hypothetical protein L3J46_04215 [Kangiellaceae bacterium]|nr:hypothetical protein [Kangiellaceae bacterium]
MYFIAAFGLVMMGLSIIMIVNPNYWSNGIIDFSRKPYFHWFEVISRLIAGYVFVVHNKSTLYPQLILSIGYLLIAVGIGLLIAGEIKHRKFAVWSAHKFKSTFRFAGIGSFMFGIFLIYVSTIGVISN